MTRVLFPRAFQLVVGCGAEPTKHKDYLKLFKLAKKYNVPDVGIVINGQLLQQEDIEIMCESGVSEITLSAHGVKRGTYEKFMTGGSHEKFLEVLELISHIRKSRGKGPAIRISYTVNPENLHELRDFFLVYGKYGIDTLQVRPAMDIGG